MGLFDKIKEPIFLKDSTKDEQIVEDLEKLADSADEDGKKQIKQEIKKIKYGIIGEKKIEFELKNSHIPMFVIHDLYLEHDGLSAQIDYLVLTKRRFFVIECKNFYGNLTICDNGDFIRTVTYNGTAKKERVYSPITQNRRHLELIRAIRSNEHNNFISKALFEKYFYENYRSIVVLANYKGFLNIKYAPKEIAEQVINADQLIDYIRKANSEKGAYDLFEKQLEDLAQYFIKCDKENPSAYLEKYQKLVPIPKDETVAEKESSTSEPVESDLFSKSNSEGHISEAKNCLNANALLENQSNDKTNQPPAISEVPICKKCGAPMIKRTAKKGKNKGNVFWGCSRFPKCRFVQNLTDKDDAS